MMTCTQLAKMTAMELAKLADDMGIAERRVWKLHGGPVKKDLLISAILERQGRYVGSRQ